MRFFFSYFIALIACSVISATNASAATIVDTGEPVSGTGWSLRYDGQTSGQFLAARFTLTDAYVLTGVEAFIKPNSDATGGAIRYEIQTDAGGLPGATLHGQNFNVVPSDPVDFQWEGLSGLSWSLSAGTYWLALLPDLNGFKGSALSNAPNPLGAYAFRNPGFGWSQSALNFGVRINGDLAVPAVPLPASLPMLIAALGGFAAARRLRKTA